MPGTPPIVRPTAQPNPEVSLSIYSPGDGYVYPMGAIDIRALGFIHQSTARTRVFLANGVSIGNGIVDPNSYFHLTWTPRTAGEYYIQAKVTLRDGVTVTSEAVRICVMSFTSSQFRMFGGYTGLCEPPTRIPDPAPSGDVAIHAVVAPNVLQFVTTAGCPNSFPKVTFIVKVDDPQDQVALVSEILINAGGTYQLPYYLNWITTRSGNQKEYRRTIELPINFYGGAVEWWVFAWGRDGRNLQQVGGTLNFEFVECGQQRLEMATSEASPSPAPLEIIPSETPTPTAVTPPTLTLKKNAFCRKGPDMSFSDVTAVLAGETVDILNISEDGFWYFIHWKKFDATCWVVASTGDVSGNVTGVQVLTGPTLSAPDAPPSEPTISPAPCNPLIRTCP
jgi:hypothetical protein